MNNIAEFREVYIDYPLKRRTLHAVSGVSLDIKRGKITALVGESGSGKTTLASSLIQCISEPGKVTSGEILFYVKSLFILKSSQEKNCVRSDGRKSPWCFRRRKVR